MAFLVFYADISKGSAFREHRLEGNAGQRTPALDLHMSCYIHKQQETYSQCSLAMVN